MVEGRASALELIGRAAKGIRAAKGVARTQKGGRTTALGSEVECGERGGTCAAMIVRLRHHQSQ